MLVVHRDRVVDPHLLHRPSDIVDTLLERKFRGMDPYHHQPLVLVLLGPSANVGAVLIQLMQV
jgi:hypothetical protein